MIINKFLINFSFFICIFLSSFSKNEVTTIEALPQREKANLDIEVLKIKTEKITGVIYENEKKIIFDFKDLKKTTEKKKIITDSSNYELFILENLDNAATYMKKNEKFKMNRIFEQGVRLRNGEKIKLKNISYSLIEQNKEKVLEVSYDLKPETFYLVVINNKTGMIEKIYKAEFTQQVTQLSTGSINDFSYTTSNNGSIIIEPNWTGDYTSDPMIIRFEQKSNSNSSLFPVIALGNETIWKKEDHNGGLPVEGSEKDIEVAFNKSSITGKMKPQLKYKNSNPSGNIGQSKKIYYHNLLESSSNKIAIGAYETSKNEFIETELTIKIDASTIEQIKSYASTVSADKNGLVEIPYKNLTNYNQISLVLGSSEGNGYYNIPSKNLSNNRFNIIYPKIYIRKIADEYTKFFSYNINGLKDHIIDENTINSVSGNYYIASLGTVFVKQEKGAYDKDRVPTIGLGSKNEWGYTGKIKNVSPILEVPNIFLNLNNKEQIYPYLIKKSIKGTLFRKVISKNIGIDDDSKAVTLGAYGTVDSITGEVKIAIPKKLLIKMKEYAYSKEEDIVELPYFSDYKISLIPSSKKRDSASIKIPDTSQGEVREILYPKIKFKKNTGNENTTDNFTSDHKLNNLDIGEKDLIESGNLERLSGFVHFYQKKMSINDKQIPMIALGKQTTAPKGYLFERNSTSIIRDSYIAVYDNKLKTYPYFKDLKGGVIEGDSTIQGGIQKSNENSNLGIWVYSDKSREEISGNLAIKIKNDDKKDFLTYIRGIKSKDVELITEEKVAFVQGSYSNGKYKFPLDSDSSRIIEIPYPKLTIVKDIIENNNIEIEFKNNYIKGEEVKFDFVGNSTNSNVEVNLNSGQFINGLELNDGKLEITYENNQLISMDMNPSGETKVTIQESKLNMSITYNNDGLASLSLNEWSGNSHTLTITHKEKSGLIRRQYTIKLKTPGPTFEVISAQDLDFGTVLKGDNSKTATSKIIIKNLSNNPLTLKTSKTEVELINGNSKITAGNFSLSEEIKDSNSGESHFILQSQLINTNTSTLEGEHKGQFYLNIELK